MPAKPKYAADPHIAEVYDQLEDHIFEFVLLRRLIGPAEDLRIFEPFCGPGRLIVPLAFAGHFVAGMDESESMLQRCRMKLAVLPDEVAARVGLLRGDVLREPWPDEMDLVLLGGNCFYELAGEAQQRECIRRAREAVVSGGHVFCDNDEHPAAELHTSWRLPPGQWRKTFPTGTCSDGTRVESFTETASFDVPGRTVHYRRKMVITPPRGSPVEHRWEETCRPVRMDETRRWLEEAGFVVEQTFGDRVGYPFVEGRGRAILWARRL